jgi:uncharacterized protein YjeT (DUF2065 family)
MVWQDFWAAVALLLTIEGILPFLNPAGLRRALTVMSEMSDAQLRIGGGVSMSLGLLLLYFVRN